MEEIWKDIPNYENLYQASNLGRIKSLDRKKEVKSKNQHSDFIYKRNIKGKIIKLKSTKDGYYEAGLTKNGKTKYIRVHRLIAMTFIENKDKLPVINHKNYNRKDNRVENLEWCSIKYNTRYSNAKKIIQLDKNKKQVKLWECMSDVYNELGICVSNLSKCCHNNNLTAGGYHWKYYE